MNGMNEGMRPSLFDQLGGGDGQDDLDWFEGMKASGTRGGGTEERSRHRRRLPYRCPRGGPRRADPSRMGA